jgi:hypothetical protein
LGKNLFRHIKLAQISLCPLLLFLKLILHIQKKALISAKLKNWSSSSTFATFYAGSGPVPRPQCLPHIFFGNIFG